MKNPLLISWNACAFTLSLFITIPTFAALPLVTAINPATSAPPDGNGDSWAPIVSPDGRHVLFASTAENLAGAGNNGIPKLNPPSVNVYLRDRWNRTTTLVSVNLSGAAGGNGSSFPTGLSTNGQFALFESAASDLVAGDTNNVNDVFLRDVVNGVTWLVSVATNGMSGNDVSRGSMITPNGRYVAFVSAAANLTSNDTNGIANVFVRDMQLDKTVLASVGAVSSGAGSSSESPEITPDGNYVAFYSTATGMVSGVTTTGEIYVRNLSAGTTAWASTNARTIANFGANAACYNQAISDNDEYVAYEISSNLASAASGYVLRYGLQTGLTDTVFTNASIPLGANLDKHSLNVTSNGQDVVFTANSGPTASCVYLWNSQSGTNLLVSGNLTGGVSATANVFWPDIDPAGRYVVFFSTDTTLTTNATAGVFLRDTQAGITTLVSVDTNGCNLAVNPTAVPSLSANGGSVAFETPWSNLDGRNYQCDVFVRDLTNAVAELVSVHDPNLPSLTPNGPCVIWPGSVSTNGHFLAFSSWASNLSPAETNGCTDVFVRDLILGTNILVSVATNGLPGNGFSSEPSISGNGRYVVFTSVAANLAANDTNPVANIYVRDLAGGTTKLVSVSTNGGFGNHPSYSPVISTDGRYVLFGSLAQNLATGTYTNKNLFLRDLQLGQTYALTTSGCQCYAMTPSGTNVAYVGSASPQTLYVRNSSTAVTAQFNATTGITNISLSPDSHWVAGVSGTSLSAWDLNAGTNFLLATGPFGPRAGLKFSGNGQSLAYAGTNAVFLYNFITGTTLLVSVAFNSTNAANGPSDSPVISADGRFVAYRSFSSNSIASDTNGVPEVFLYDSLSNATLLVSANLSGVPGGNRSLAPVFSGDGQTLAFQSWASDLAAQDFNPGSDVFALDMFSVAGTNSAGAPTLPDGQITFASDFSASLTPVITWPFTPGKNYSVQYKNNLTDPAWQTMAGTVAFFGSQAFLSDAAPAAGQRFYRILQN